MSTKLMDLLFEHEEDVYDFEQQLYDRAAEQVDEVARGMLIAVANIVGAYADSTANASARRHREAREANMQPQEYTDMLKHLDRGRKQ